MAIELPNFEWPVNLPRTCTREMLFLAIKEWTLGAKRSTLAEILNIPVHAVPRYIRNPGWTQTVKQLRPLLDVEIENRLTRNVQLALNELEDRLEHGNKVVDRSGVEHRAPLNASELSVIAASLFDKRAHARKLVDGVDPEPPDAARSLAAIANLLRDHDKFQPTRPQTVDAEEVSP